MRPIRFEQATSHIDLPNIGSVPFVKVEDDIAVYCLEITDKELEQIKASRRVYIIAPTVPPDKDRPVHVTLSFKDPFIPIMKSNGKES
jgi:hypothetical protein